MSFKLNARAYDLHQREATPLYSNLRNSKHSGEAFKSTNMLAASYVGTTAREEEYVRKGASTASRS